MHVQLYSDIDQLGAHRIAPLIGSTVDFSYGLLRAMERTLWGDIAVRYIAVEEGQTLLGFLPVYVGTNIEFMAAMPDVVRRAYPLLIEKLGLNFAYKVTVAGSLISDRGFVPLLPDVDGTAVVNRLIDGIDEFSRAEKVKLCIVKDMHQDFPALSCFQRPDFVQTYSLPTVRVDTPFSSTEGYVSSLSANGRSHARRTLRKVAQNFTIRAVADYASFIPQAYPLFRATYLKAQFKLEEPPPQFFLECSRVQPPQSEMLLCEREGRLVGAYLILFDAHQQLNKRIGIDYREEESPLIYNALNYHCLLRAVERGIPLSYLGQTTYTPKLRMGGRLENQFLFIKGYDLSVRMTLPLQKVWMNRFRAERVQQEAGQSPQGS